MRLLGRLFMLQSLDCSSGMIENDRRLCLHKTEGPTTTTPKSCSLAAHDVTRRPRVHGALVR